MLSTSREAPKGGSLVSLPGNLGLETLSPVQLSLQVVGELRIACVKCLTYIPDDIKLWLKEFRCPLEVISPAVEALQKLCHAYSNSPEETQVGLGTHV